MRSWCQREPKHSLLSYFFAQFILYRCVRVENIVERRISVQGVDIWQKSFQNTVSRNESTFHHLVHDKLPVFSCSWQMPNVLLWKRLVEFVKVSWGTHAHLGKAIACFDWILKRQVWTNSEVMVAHQFPSLHLGLKDINLLVGKKIKGFVYLLLARQRF